MVLLAFLQMLDFLLTWIGVNNLEVITEGNPLLVFLFNMRFLPALFLRIIQVTIIIIPLLLIKQISSIIYFGILFLGIIVNLYVLSMHIEWIKIYIEYRRLTKED